MDNTNGLIKAMLDMGEAMIGSGAEIYRAEDTLRRIGKAYGAVSCEIFIITSNIVITVQMGDEKPATQTRRIRRSVNNDFTKLEDLNELSREVCRNPIPVPELLRKIDAISGRKQSTILLLTGDILAGAFFAVFFHGSALDGIAAGLVGALIWALQTYVAPICMNMMVFEFIASFVSGALICLFCGFFPFLHMDQIMIGDIMLLVPGVAFTNSFRDILLGDTLSGILRFVEAMLLAFVLTLGFLSAIFLFGKNSAPTTGVETSSAVQLAAGAIGSVGFGLMYNLRKKYWLSVAVGGFLGWFVYLMCGSHLWQGIFLPTLAAAFVTAIFAEIMARICKAPSTVFFITAVIPLIPGSSLYYGIYNLVMNDLPAASNYGADTFLYAVAIAAGMSIAWTICDFSRKVRAAAHRH